MTEETKPFGGTINDYRILHWGRCASVLGTLTKDERGRFGANTPIRTSFIVSHDKETGEIETLNTRYQLGTEFEHAENSDK